MTRFDHDWEERLHEELSALPDRRSPAGLLSKVLAAAEAREPAWKRVWWRLPDWGRSAALTVAGAAAAAAFYLEAGLAAKACAAAVGPWGTVLRGLSRAFGQASLAAGALAWDWRLPLAGLALACLTACASGTVAVGVLAGAGRRTRTI